MADEAIEAHETVREMIAACWKTQIIAQGVRFGVFDRLGTGPATASNLAARADANKDTFLRMLRALAFLGLVEQRDSSTFALTKAGALLRRDCEHSLSGFALHTAERLWDGYGSLGTSIRTGGPSVPSGAEHFAAMQQDPLAADVFNRSMAEQSLRVGQAVAEAYDFSGFSRVSDVGGGYGALLAGVLQAYPALQGEVFDMPALKERAQAYLDEQGVGDRARYVGGNFFEHIPPGECFMLKYIIHDWGDGQSRTILAHCAEAAGDAGRVLLIERIVPEIVTPSPEIGSVIQGDLAMMSVGGKERTEPEYRALLAQAGLDLIDVIETATEFAIIDARVRR